MCKNYKKLVLSKKFVVISFTIIFHLMTFIRFGLCECREETIVLMPGVTYSTVLCQECFFLNTDEVRKAPNLKEIEGQLSMGADKLPKSAKDIYYMCHGSFRGSTTYFSLILPSSEEAIKFAEELAGRPIPVGMSIDESKVPISNFRKGISTTKLASRAVIEGPESCGEKWKSPYWNLKDVKNGKCYENYNARRFIAIDLDTNRVYLCILG